MWKKLPLTFSHLPIHIVTFFMSTFHTDCLMNIERDLRVHSIVQVFSGYQDIRVSGYQDSEIVVLQYSKNILLMHNVVFNSILEGIKSFESCKPHIPSSPLSSSFACSSPSPSPCYKEKNISIFTGINDS